MRMRGGLNMYKDMLARMWARPPVKHFFVDATQGFREDTQPLG